MLYELPLQRDECEICTFYISQWQISGDKTIMLQGRRYHKACLIDYKLRTGVDYVPKTQES